jgi:hypothetical protein
MESNALMLIALLGAHWFFDYAGQGDFMAKAKNVWQQIPGVPYMQVLMAHAGIHGAAAALITGLWWVFFAEMFVHFVVDDLKCRNRISFREDQLIHIACKVVWWAAAAAVVLA